MNTLITRQLALAPDFAWSQSAIGTYLECPRAFYLKHVERRRLDHVASGFAGPLGNGTHAGAHAVLDAATQRKEIAPEAVRKLMLTAFDEAVTRAQKKGEVFDDESVEAAMARLEGELFEWVMALERDRRVRAIAWTCLEQKFGWTDRHGRKYQGTVDAAGVTRDYVDAFASRGPGEMVSLEAGTHVIVDWKTGEVAVDFVSRTLNVQLAFYRTGLLRQGLLPAGSRPRTFLARLQDVMPPKRPKDAHGEAIPRLLTTANHAFLEAVGIDPASDGWALAHEQCRKRPKDADGKPIPKWLERDNPAFVEATSKPRGPVFYACDISYELATRTINDVIRGAEAGLFPAAGAANGGCLRCEFRRTCTSSTATESTTTRTTS